MTMYHRLDELKEYKKKNNIGVFTLANKIPLNLLTLKRVLAGKDIYQATGLMIDAFLDNPPDDNIDLKKIFDYQKDKGLTLSQLCEEIGIPYRTVLNIMKNKHNPSEGNKTLLKNFLKKIA